MYNPLLDPLPDSYAGYLIRTDYRIGVQIALCQQDPELNDYEKAAVMIGLLYGAGAPEPATAMQGVQWFMLCGEEPQAEDAEEAPCYSFQKDAGRIYSAFRKRYGMDITKERMHWFQFCALLADASGTLLQDVMGVRQMDTSGLRPKDRAYYSKLKRRFALSDTYTGEEQTLINAFLEKINQPQQITP